MPSLMRSSYDSRYLPTVEAAMQAVRGIRPAVRAQLSKDYAVEDDDIRMEVRERLEGLTEGLRMLDGDEDDSQEGEDERDADEDY
jgi:hypothetical protein